MGKSRTFKLVKTDTKVWRVDEKLYILLFTNKNHAKFKKVIINTGFSCTFFPEKPPLWP